MFCSKQRRKVSFSYFSMCVENSFLAHTFVFFRETKSDMKNGPSFIRSEGNLLSRMYSIRKRMCRHRFGFTNAQWSSLFIRGAKTIMVRRICYRICHKNKIACMSVCALFFICPRDRLIYQISLNVTNLQHL